MGDIGGPIDARTTAARKFDVQPAATGPKAKIPNHDSNPPQVCTRLAAGGKRIRTSVPAMKTGVVRRSHELRSFGNAGGMNVERDQKFESTSLQRRVRGEFAFR